LNFFLDNCISPRIAKALQALEDRHTVIALRDKFQPDTPDVEWIRKLAQEKQDWVVISGDNRISRNKHEHEAWIEAKLTFFFWAPAWLALERWQQASKIIKWWPAIVDQASKIAPGAGFKIPVKGTRLEQIR
jgi:hypothetical protein